MRKPSLASAELLGPEMIGELGLDQLLPARLAVWGPLIAEGLDFFLSHLPAERLAAIAADQFSLGTSASPARRLVSLIAHCPTLHKLGQVLARHPRLPVELRRELQSLESMAPATEIGQVLAGLREELPDSGRVHLSNEVLAEGSVAVVLPFRYEERSHIRHGVFKLLKPGIEGKLAEEFSIWPAMGVWLERRARALGLPPLACREPLEDVQALLANEVRLDLEQQHMRAAARFYAHQPRLLIPRLLPWCTPRVTAMERVFGVKVTDAQLSRPQRRELASVMVSSLIGLPYWNKAEQSLIHADLHAGNLLVTDDGRLAVLDWSLTVRFGKAQREALLAIVLGGITLDGEKIRAAVSALGRVPADDPALIEAVEQALGRVVRGHLPGFDWLLALLDDIALRTSIGFRDDLALLRKTWMSLSGVLRDLDGDLAPDPVLLALGVRRFFEELPGRPFAAARTRSFSTHASNSDLLGLLASPWLIALRYWARRMSAQRGLLASV